MIIDRIILFITIFNFLLTLFVFLSAKKLKQHISFLALSFTSTLWLFSNFLLRIYPQSIYNQLSYGLGVLVGTTGLLWFYNLVGEEVPKFVKYLVIPLSILVFFISSFTNYVVLSFSALDKFGFAQGQKGILFTEYALYVGLLLMACLYKLAKKSLQEKDILKKKQVFSIFIGCMCFGITVVVVDFLMPIFFDNFKEIYLDNITYLLFLLLIIYSIVRHNLFGIKIVLTQLLVVTFLALLLLNFLFSQSINQYMWSGSIFLISTFLSYLIMKSVFREMKIYQKILQETQKNLEFEKKVSKKIIEISQDTIKKLEREIGA